VIGNPSMSPATLASLSREVFQVGDDDAARSGLRIGARHRFADAARSARDDADLALDVHFGSPLVSFS
jgi:hypothetical protein